MLPLTHWLVASHILESIDYSPISPCDAVMFKIGSILPDLWPATFMNRHNREDSMPVIRGLIGDLRFKPRKSTVVGDWLAYIRMGVVCHYICDLFCRSHNETKFLAPGAHLAYEYELDLEIRRSQITEIIARQDLRISSDIRAGMGIDLESAIERCHSRYISILGDCSIDIYFALNVAHAVIRHLFTATNEETASAQLAENAWKVA